MFWFFFFNDTATTEIYTLSLHDALPILEVRVPTAEAMRALGEAIGRVAREGDLFLLEGPFGAGKTTFVQGLARGLDRKSTRLNSSHANISYAVFCLKKKKNTHHSTNALH